MRRAFIWSVRLFAIFGVLTSIVLLLYVFSAPSIAEHQILKALKEMGIADASVQVRSIGTNHLQITNLNLGDEAGLRIGAVGVDYDVTLTGSLTVKTVEIIGATLDLRSKDGKLDIGPLADIRSAANAAQHVDDGLPVDRIIVRNSSINVQWNGRRFALPFEATLTHKQHGECDVDATLWLLGTAVPVKGAIDFTASESVATAAANPVADRISFRMTTPLMEETLVVAGSVGSLSAGTSIAASIEQAGDAGHIAIAAFTQSAESGSKLIVKTNLSPRPLRLALGGYEIDAADFSLVAAGEFEVDQLRFTGHIEAGAKRLHVMAAGLDCEWNSPLFAGDFNGNEEERIYTVQGRDLPHMQFESMMIKTIGKTPQIAKLGPTRIDCTLGRLRWPLVNDPMKQAELQLDLAIEKPQVVVEDHHVTFARIEPRLRLLLDADGGLSLAGSVKLTDGLYQNKPRALEVAGIEVTLPFTLNGKTPAEDGIVQIKSIRMGKEDMPPMTGTMHIDNGMLSAALAWPWQRTNPVRLAAKLNLLKGLDGSVSVRWKDIHLEDEKALAKLLKAAKPFLLTGRFDLDAEITLKDGSLRPLIVFVASDANFTASDLDLNLRGIETTIIINSIDPLSTLPNQRLAVGNGNIGELRFKDVITNFRLDGINAMVLELAAWRVGNQGRFWMHAAHFDPLNPALETQVFIEDMSVAEWLQIVQDNKITGQGLLYGRIPVRINRSRDPVLTFGEGFLYAKPGKGWIKLAERAEDRRQTYETIEQAIADLAKEAKRRLLEAVNDYEFDTLQFDFVRQNSTILCRVTTAGRGRTGFKQEVGGLTVNIDNFGALLSERILRNANSLGALDDELERLFE